MTNNTNTGFIAYLTNYNVDFKNILKLAESVRFDVCDFSNGTLFFPDEEDGAFYYTGDLENGDIAETKKFFISLGFKGARFRAYSCEYLNGGVSQSKICDCTLI